MLDKAKQIHKLKKMQSEIQKQLEQIMHTEEKNDVVLVVRGDKKIESITIDGEERKDIKELINDTFKKVDKKAEKKMRSQAGDMMSMFGM